MRRYLDVHRLVLLGDKTSQFLWLSQYGEAITPDGFSRQLPKVTEQHLKVSLRPHAFRHIAATSIAEIDPEHVNIICDILGHTTLAMAQKHYNRATGIRACNAYQDLTEKLRDRRNRTR
jgi:site-specific recombinase XerD